MAILSDKDRKSVWAKYMEDISAVWEPMDLNKIELQAVVDAIDTSLDKAVVYDGLSAKAAANLTPKQQAHILVYVATKRWEVL